MELQLSPGHDEGTAIRQLDTFCTACHERQFMTPSGATCPNGHGGMEGAEWAPIRSTPNMANQPGAAIAATPPQT